MTKADFNDLCCGLNLNKSIKSFDLFVMHIDGEGAQILANGNIRNAPLTELAIIPPRSMSHRLEIFAALQANPNCRIETFILCSRNTNEGAALSMPNVLLCHTKTLKTLKLPCN